MSDPARRPKLKSLEDKLHYIFDRIECGKMVMNNMDAKVEVLTNEIAGLIDTESTATDELRKHIDGGDEKVASEGEKNPSLKQGLDNYAGTVDSVVSLDGMRVGRMRNVQLELKSFHNCARRALVQLQEFNQIDQEVEKTQKSLGDAKGTNAKTLHGAHLEGLKGLTELAEATLVRELQDYEDERVRVVRKVLGDYCHLNMEYHARALAAFYEAAAAAKAIEPQSIEEVVGLQVRELAWLFHVLVLVLSVPCCVLFCV
jgi:hypothetical protein